MTSFPHTGAAYPRIVSKTRRSVMMSSSCLSNEENINAGPPPSFLGIPLDVRVLIYKLLLVNPTLGLSISVSERSGFGCYARYNLHPNVLAVCKQTYQEGASILYGINKFYSAPLPDSSYVTGSIQCAENNICPITRYLQPSDRDEINFEDTLRGAGALATVKALTAVRNWNVILAVGTADERGQVGAMTKAPMSLVRFCNAILRSSPRNMDIAIIPKGVQRVQDPSAEFIPMAVILKPLSNVHNIENVTFRDATILEVPDAIEQDEDTLEFHSHMQEEAVLEVQLVERMQSNSKVEFAFEMYHPLLRYAQSFERYEPYKKLMALTEEEYLWNEGLDSGDYYEVNCEKGNPFRARNIHPVERHVMAAKAEAIRDDIGAFKRCRMLVLQYLESQFQRVVTAENDLSDFILSEKRCGGLFDVEAQGEPVTEPNECKVLSALVLLEEYAASFRRDMPIEIKIQARGYPRFESLYAIMDSNFQLERVRAYNSGDYRHIIKWYRNAVDEFDKEYLEIRAARKELFRFDELDEYGVTLGPENMRLDEPIRCDINEPELGPLSKEDYGYYSDDDDHRRGGGGENNDDPNDDNQNEDDRGRWCRRRPGKW